MGVRSCLHCRHGVELDAEVDPPTCPACHRRLHVEDARAEAAFHRFRQEQRLKVCPQCGATVEKTAGCNGVRCRCGVHFCFSCGKILGGSYRSHFNEGRCRLYDH